MWSGCDEVGCAAVVDVEVGDDRRRLGELVLQLVTDADVHVWLLLLGAGEERLGGRGQEAREALRPGVLGGGIVVGDQVLADLELDAGDAARLAVMDEREVREIGGGVGLVAADDEIAVGSGVAQEAEQRFGQARVAVEEDAAVPGAGDVEEDGREAVDGDEDRGRRAARAGVEVVADLGVVGAEDLGGARGGVGGREVWRCPGCRCARSA